MSERIPLLLDTDLGSDVDDALALGVLLAEPDAIDWIAVTTVAGDTRARARATARLLGLAGLTDLEVCAGDAAPLLRKNRFVWREIETAGYPEGPDARLSDEPGPERIARAAAERPGLEILAIGPLTNLARALALDPKLPEKVSRLSIMGGHVRRVAIGELVCRPGIDYNLCSDPEASMAVLGAGFETRLVTADVTLQTWLTDADVERLASGGRIAQTLAALVRIWKPFMHQLFTGLGGTLADDNAAFLHDPLTALALLDASPLGFERLRILPTIERGVFRTLEVPAEAKLGAPMQVATRVDSGAARAAIVSRLARL